MSKIKIVCTSTGAIEYGPERYRELGIDILRIHMIFKGVEYLEGPDFDPVKFYSELETLDDPKNNLPKTSLPSPAEIYACFDKAISEGYDEMIIFSISTGLGGTYNAISTLSKDYVDKIKIHVVDTKICAFSEGYHAIRAQEMVNRGMSAEEILKETEWAIKNQEFVGVDGRLDYLIYNGRLKGAKAFMGRLLNICPVLTFNNEGEVVPLESVRTPKKALARACEIMKELIGDRDPKDYLLYHIYTGPSLLNELVKIEEKYGIKTNHEDVIMTPVSGCHNGPWLAGYGLYRIRREDEML
ncbi:MAG: DegV family protein [Clostridia bacterium]|nr:DegV family protein [Clostridia bacterium]